MTEKSYFEVENQTKPKSWFTPIRICLIVTGIVAITIAVVITVLVEVVWKVGQCKMILDAEYIICKKYVGNSNTYGIIVNSFDDPCCFRSFGKFKNNCTTASSFCINFMDFPNPCASGVNHNECKTLSEGGKAPVSGFGDRPLTIVFANTSTVVDYQFYDCNSHFTCEVLLTSGDYYG